MRASLKGTPGVRGRRRGVDEIAGHHSDDEIRIPVEHDPAPNDAGVAGEAPLDEARAQQNHVRPAHLIFGRVEVAANGGLDANWIVRHGIPTITFGAGQNDIHTIKEWVDLDEFDQGCRLAVILATMAA